MIKLIGSCVRYALCHVFLGHLLTLAIVVGTSGMQLHTTEKTLVQCTVIPLPACSGGDDEISADAKCFWESKIRKTVESASMGK